MFAIESALRCMPIIRRGLPHPHRCHCPPQVESPDAVELDEEELELDEEELLSLPSSHVARPSRIA
eukprot:5823022-Lingulodinium_polyedra.AAC.1